MKTTIVHISGECHKALKVYAKAKGMKVGAVAVEAVKDYIRSEKLRAVHRE